MSSDVQATVISGTGGVWQVRTDDGETRDVSLRGRLKKVDGGRRADGSRRRDTVRAAAESLKLAVGDRVTLEEEDRGTSWVIAGILPRRSQLARREPGGGHGERVVAANVDQMVVVFAAAKPEPHLRMLDRFLVIAEANGLAALVVINKSELVGEARARAAFSDYLVAGYPLHVTSVRAPFGLEELHDALAGRTSVLSGPSGVGKSSLMNAMFPGLDLRVAEISDSVNKGRHTTVGALLHPLPGGGYVVDTPGLREVGMWGLESTRLAECYPELRALAASCRFGDCSHRREPGCAVLEALERGVLSAERYDSYARLREEIEAEEREPR